MRQETIGYEDLSVVAADGAAAQGARLTNPTAKPVTMLVLFPWTAGIEITTIQCGKECIPLTWLNEERHMIPMRTDGCRIRHGKVRIHVCSKYRSKAPTKWSVLKYWFHQKWFILYHT